MKKYKEDIKTIIEVSIFLLVFVAQIYFQNAILTYIGTGALFLIWILNIIDHIKYRNNPAQNELRFPTENDDYSKYTLITIGTCLFIGSIWFATWVSEFSYILVFAGIAGALLLLNGLIYTPGGNILFEENNLTGSGIETPIQNESLNSIEISDEKITYSFSTHDEVVQQEAKLNEEWKEKIQTYLESQLNTRHVNMKRV